MELPNQRSLYMKRLFPPEVRRLQRHLAHFQGTNPEVSMWSSPTAGGRGRGDVPPKKTVRIGDVEVEVRRLEGDESDWRQDLVPVCYMDIESESQATLQALRWMIQKHQLKQDIFLIGPPGPERRRLALRYCELLEREAEYLAITRDTTEADLKQRAEVLNGSLYYVNQAPVKCALNGRVLVLDGIEKAERNVLPTLNNLLENREMELDDGSSLIPHTRYDALVKEGHSPEELTKKRLLRCHPDFRVIALGLPVPRFPGYPLDPPLRSRFQCKSIGSLSFRDKIKSLETLYPSLPSGIIRKLVSVRETLRLIEQETPKFSKRLPHFPEGAVDYLAKVLSIFPPPIASQMFNKHLISRVYPFQLATDRAQWVMLDECLARFKISTASEALPRFTAMLPGSGPREISVEFEGEKGTKLVLPFAGGSEGTPSAEDMGSGSGSGSANFVLTPFHRLLLSPLLQDLMLGKDACVVGEKGCGKSALVRYLAGLAGYNNSTYTLHLFKDMTSRDLLQRRTTDPDGNTVWKPSTLVTAALEGGLVVLDGVDRLPSSTLSVLAPLIQDRALNLSDGTRLVRHDRFAELQRTYTVDQLAKLKIFPIQPSFRLLALGLPPDLEHPDKNWLREETISLFNFHYMPVMTDKTKLSILRRIFGPQLAAGGKAAVSAARKLVKLCDTLAGNDSDSAQTSTKDTTTTTKTNTKQKPSPKANSGKNGPQVKSKPSTNSRGDKGVGVSLSLRQLIRLARRALVYPADGAAMVRRTLFVPFLPFATRTAVEEIVADSFPGALAESDAVSTVHAIETLGQAGNRKLRIGDIVYPISEDASNPELIPDILFYDIPQHIRVLRELLKDFIVGEKHILLIGNQGVGKNKLADRLLQLLRLEREYMQLHRDTTVQALTLSPTLREGKVVYEDSALVRAVEFGRVLVIDEADKAPLEVVSILKGLVEDGQMMLSDGRRIVRGGDVVNGENEGQFIRVHENFRVFVLANRPGFPFLGNDFFREVGDVFSCHIIDNPDEASEIELLKAYGPDVPEELVSKLVAAFGSLRALVEEGTFSYPYSTRELVNVVKHLQQFPNDGLLTSLQNVLAFDTFDPLLITNLQRAFALHDIPLGTETQARLGRPVVDLAPLIPLPTPEWIGDWKNDDKSGVVMAKILSMKTRARSWRVDLGSPKETLGWEQGRLHRFSEEKVSWAIDVQRGGVAAGVASLPDSSIHVLCTKPLAVYSYFKSSEYTKCTVLDLEVFLPISTAKGEIEDSLHMVAVPSTNQLAFFASTGYMVLVRIPDFSAKKDGVRVVEEARVSVITWPGSKMSDMIDFIDPNFKMARYNATSSLLSTSDSRSTVSLSKTGLLARITSDRKGLDIMDVSVLPPLSTTNPSVVVCRTIEFPFEVARVISLGLEPQSGVVIEAKDGTRFTSTNKQLQECKSSLALRSIQGPQSSTLYHTAWTFLQKNKKGQTKDGEEEGRVEIDSILVPVPVDIEDDDDRSLCRLESGGALSGHGKSNVYDVQVPEQLEGCRFEKVNCTLRETGQYAVATTTVGDEGEVDERFLTIVDFVGHTLRSVPLPKRKSGKGLETIDIDDMSSVSSAIAPPYSESSTESMPDHVTDVCTLNNDQEVVVLRASGEVVVLEVCLAALETGSKAWKRLFGLGRQAPLRLEIKSDSKKEISKPKQGKWDGKEHHGGNTFKGGTGGSDTAGLGGRGGPYRLDSGNNVYQVSDEAKAAVPKEVTAAARAIAKKELAKKLSEIDMGTEEHELYEKYLSKVTKQIVQLRLVLEQAEAKTQEREWLRNQQQGDLDDSKLVDALTGERTVYRRRATATPQHGLPQAKPKRMQFVLDVSGSMYRFNGHDNRLERLMETTLLVMEALAGFEHKFSYSLVGHSGDGPSIRLTEFGSPPQTRKDRLKVLQKMVAHSQYCMSGDHTLEATRRAVEEVTAEEGDDYFVITISDANLARYGITPGDLSNVLLQNAKVSAYVVFIASLANEATELLPQLPSGRAFFCQETAELPGMMRSILTASAVTEGP